jgi:hypothetical protein
MLQKLIVCLITMSILLVSAIVILLTHVVAMNGFSESAAMWGFGTYVVLAVIVVAGMTAGAMFVTRVLVRKGMSPVLSSLIAIPAFVIVGIVGEVLCSLIGAGVAEFVRVTF